MKMKKILSLLLAAATAMTAAIPAFAQTNADVAAAISAGGLVTLEADAELGESFTIDGKSVTLDLNGHTLKYTSVEGINVVNGASLTIKDSSADESGKMVFDVKSTADNADGEVRNFNVTDSSFTLESGSIEGYAEGAEFMYCVIMALNSKVSITGGRIYYSGNETTYMQVAVGIDNGSVADMSGGIIESAKGSAACEDAEVIAFINSNGTVNVSGGTVISPICIVVSAYQVTPKFFVSGGTISASTLKLHISGGGSGKADYIVSGGTFTDDKPSENYFADGCVMDENGRVTQTKAEVSTENIGTAEGDAEGDVATGFVTTLSANGAFDFNSIYWVIDAANGSATTAKAAFAPITINGDASFGLIVEGLSDSAATAKAVVNE